MWVGEVVESLRLVWPHAVGEWGVWWEPGAAGGAGECECVGGGEREAAAEQQRSSRSKRSSDERRRGEESKRAREQERRRRFLWFCCVGWSLFSLKAPFVPSAALGNWSDFCSRRLLSISQSPCNPTPRTHPHSLPLLYEDFVEARGRFCVAVGLIPASDQASG